MINRLFLQILKAEINGEELHKDIKFSREETDELLRLAQVHRVLPLVFDKVHDRLCWEGDDKEVFLKRIKLMVLQQSLREDAFISLYEDLQKNGLAPVVVKGIVCRNLYSKPEFRLSSDEDLLICAEDVEAYDKALSQLNLRKQENHRENSYEISYFSDEGLHIELHTSLFSTHTEYFNRYNELLRGCMHRAVYVQSRSGSFLTLSPTDHLIYLVLHALKHFINGGVGIRQVCDILLFVRKYDKEIDFAKVKKRLGSVKAKKFTAGIFAIGGKHLGFQREADLYLPLFSEQGLNEEALLSDILCAGVYGDATLSRRHSAGITWDAVQGKKRTFVHRVFPPLRELDSRFDYARKFPVLLPFAWIHRICAYSGKISKKKQNSPIQALEIAKERTELLRSLGLFIESR